MIQRHARTPNPLPITLACLALAAGCNSADGPVDVKDAGEGSTGVEGGRSPDAGPEQCVTGVTCPFENPCLDDGTCDCDRDGDGEDAVACDGEDCDDADPTVGGKGAREVCDDKDNDCDLVIDEDDDILQPDGTVLPKGLQNLFLVDEDGDGYARPSRDDDTGQTRSCLQSLYKYVRADRNLGDDLNDDDPTVYPNAPERCDGVDNDDNGQIDQEDSKFDIGDIEFPRTEVLCTDDGRIVLECLDPDTLWCPQFRSCPDGEDYCRDKWVRGCDFDATRLSSCRACETDCKFRCGDLLDGAEDGCDGIVDIVGGTFHSCGLTEQGVVACWGRGQRGQLGTGSQAAHATPQRVTGIEPATSVAAGSHNTCAIVGDQARLMCWGDNGHAQLGVLETLDYSSEPLQVSAGFTSLPFIDADTPTYLRHVVSAAITSTHACAAHATGWVFCWGSAANGRLGNGETAGESSSPTLTYFEDELYDPTSDPAVKVVLGPAQAMGTAAGARGHGCLLTQSGGVYCWGDNTLGQLGEDPAGATEEPAIISVPDLVGVVVDDIAAGVGFTCALADGEVLCWGADDVGQLGRPDDSTQPLHTPAPVQGIVGASQIVVGSYHACARVDGETLCWGAAFQGQGGAREPGEPAPAELAWGVDDPDDLYALAAGTCTASTTGQVWCVGANEYGQLGTGTPSFTPQRTAQPLSPMSGSSN